MKVKSPAQKILLRSLFSAPNQQGIIQPRSFSVDKLKDAGSALTKIEECSSPLKDDPTRLEFNDVEIIFTPAEIAILKPLFDEQEEWGINNADPVLELKLLFDGK